jgi:hypothetical protein
MFAALSATGLEKVIFTWVASVTPRARTTTGATESPSTPITAWIAGNQAAAILS